MAGVLSELQPIPSSPHPPPPCPAPYLSSSKAAGEVSWDQTPTQAHPFRAPCSPRAGPAAAPAAAVAGDSPAAGAAAIFFWSRPVTGRRLHRLPLSLRTHGRHTPTYSLCACVYPPPTSDGWLHGNAANFSPAAGPYPEPLPGAQIPGVPSVAHKVMGVTIDVQLLGS